MNDSAQPNWDLLPYDPTAFFELEGDFDRKGLKRKYNALIRVYKPERFPEEFQKIRAAYESLDGQLRYGQTNLNVQSASTYQWKSDANSKPNDPSVGGTTRNAGIDADQESKLDRKGADQPQPIHERMSSESPASIYKELNSKTDKIPFDFFALALISDIVTEDKTMFLKWILTGLKTFPDEPGLYSMLYEYFQEDVPEEILASVLLTTSKVISDERFYFLTEKLWDKLLQKKDFKEFRSTLERCEQNLKDFRIEGRLAFYVHIIRAAIWSADKEWIAQAYDLIDEHASEMPPTLEMDVELLYLLRDYKESHQKIIGDNVIRKRIHSTIVAYFTKQEAEGDKAVIRRQSMLANDARDLLNAFPVGLEGMETMLYPWEYITDEVCQRHDLVPNVDYERLAKHAFELLVDRDRSENLSSFNEITRLAMTYGPYVLLAGTPFFLLYSWLDNSLILFVAVMLAVALPVAGHFLLEPHHLFERKIQRRVRKSYRGNWRYRFVQLIESSQATHHELTSATMQVITVGHKNLLLTSRVYEQLPEDYGLAFFALAVRFVR